MVKILERGTAPDPWWMQDRWRCTWCKSVVQFEPGDEEAYGVRYDDEYEWHDGCAVTANCPVCGREGTCFDRVKPG